MSKIYETGSKERLAAVLEACLEVFGVPDDIAEAYRETKPRLDAALAQVETRIAATNGDSHG